jgi:putative oxidoreductase
VVILHAFGKIVERNGDGLLRECMMTMNPKIVDPSSAAGPTATLNDADGPRVAPFYAANLPSALEFVGRTFLISLFLISGLNKITGYEATMNYMNVSGVPGSLLPVVIAFEVLAAIALLVGWKARTAAFLLAGFTMLAGLIFHGNLADPLERLWFLNNVAITGGFLLLVANGAGDWSIDHRRRGSTAR